MNMITQMITQQLSGTISSQIAQRLGISEGTANMAVQMAVPVILAGLARNASQPEGAQALHQAVADHDGSILDNLMGHVGNPQSADGAGILGHVLGDNRSNVENNLAQATGIDQGTAGNVMEMVAPMVMGALGKTQKENGLDASGLSNLLATQQQQAAAAQPGMMGTISSLLDSNKDGSVVDDLSRIAGTFFK